jgi:hypothetical protein
MEKIIQDPKYVQDTRPSWFRCERCLWLFSNTCLSDDSIWCCHTSVKDYVHTDYVCENWICKTCWGKWSDGQLEDTDDVNSDWLTNDHNFCESTL